ncbi:hypothetical protein [Noviherbaspirillum sp. UKPF54]|uniref:hypothetical protein n=1 Tax=Noviherbaspirillum sp. UKPF54 TaxID=2601898 RepID=UPI0011B1A20B|nr:hypothetical protein [Noviherbaspirillum sp. UKPF54]QDZ26577.1 hypothetical protein FAY22_00495 [Noviherbaspirillum sp. UKPF54]
MTTTDFRLGHKASRDYLLTGFPGDDAQSDRYLKEFRVFVESLLWDEYDVDCELNLYTSCLVYDIEDADSLPEYGVLLEMLESASEHAWNVVFLD